MKTEAVPSSPAWSKESIHLSRLEKISILNWGAKASSEHESRDRVMLLHLGGKLFGGEYLIIIPSLPTDVHTPYGTYISVSTSARKRSKKTDMSNHTVCTPYPTNRSGLHCFRIAFAG